MARSCADVDSKGFASHLDVSQDRWKWTGQNFKSLNFFEFGCVVGSPDVDPVGLGTSLSPGFGSSQSGVTPGCGR